MNERRAIKYLAFAAVLVFVVLLVTAIVVPIIFRIEVEMGAWELATEHSAYRRGLVEAELDYRSGERTLKSPPPQETRTDKNVGTWPHWFAMSKYVEGYNTRMKELLTQTHGDNQL